MRQRRRKLLRRSASRCQLLRERLSLRSSSSIGLPRRRLVERNKLRGNTTQLAFQTHDQHLHVSRVANGRARNATAGRKRVGVKRAPCSGTKDSTRGSLSSRRRRSASSWPCFRTPSPAGGPLRHSTARGFERSRLRFPAQPRTPPRTSTARTRSSSTIGIIWYAIWQTGTWRRRSTTRLHCTCSPLTGI